MDNIKLTPKQDFVVFCLQNGWELITDSSMKGAIVGNAVSEFHINNGIFFRLLDKALIRQQIKWPFDYILTPIGKKYKTKRYNI